MLVRTRAPLRLGLAGGGTDVSPFSEKFGGYVLNATISLYAYCTLEITNNETVSFYAADRNEYFESGAISYINPEGDLILHKGVYNRIIKDFNGGNPLSVSITTYSDAPAGSGLGSSSTMVVAIIKAFVEALTLPLGEYEIAQLAYQIERQELCLSGGKQDQYAATFGGFNFIEFHTDNRVIVNPLRIKNWIINELEASMILYYTGTSRESAKIIEEQTRNTASGNQKSIDALLELKSDAVIMKEAILKGDILKFSEHLGKSWEAKKKTASSITNSSINDIYNAAMEAGAYSGKVSGAGGGGFMMFMADPVKRIAVINCLSEFNGQVIPFQFEKDGTRGWKI